MNIKISRFNFFAQPTLQNDNLSPFWEIKILLVETNPSIIRMVEKVLENTRVMHFLRRINNPQDLNFELVYSKPDVIITGRTLDNMNAKQVLDLTRIHAPALPIIVLATDYNEQLNFELIENGAYDIIFHSEIKRLPHEIAFLSEEFKKRKIA